MNYSLQEAKAAAAVASTAATTTATVLNKCHKFNRFMAAFIIITIRRVAVALVVENSAVVVVICPNVAYADH